MRLVSICLVLAAPAMASQTPAGAQPQAAVPATAEFNELDNIEGDHIDLVFAPYRPMALAPSDVTLFAVNTHNSKVLRFDDLSGQPTSVFDVPWGPVSVAYWESNIDGHAEVLVVSQGTYALTRLDPVTGEILGMLPLPPEPADILIDEATDRAWVSCSARDEVVLIDLQSNTIEHTYRIKTSRHLGFLSFDAEGHVLVAPMLSGNNSVARRSELLLPEQADLEGHIADLDDPTVANVGLPDHDLFRIRTDIEGAEPEVVATGVGTNLFAHALHPVTGETWLVNTEANNKDPDRQTEPSILGEVVFDRITRVQVPAVGSPPVDLADHTIIDLDDADPTVDGTQYGDVVSKPYDIHFTTSGFAFVVGTSSDNVRLMDPDGDLLAQWDVADGSLPRAVDFSELLGLVLVYNWGSNTVSVYNLYSPDIPFVVDLQLGYDPTPPLAKRGRELFFDGDNSLHGNATCESCHIDGGGDMLAWNLSDGPYDDKGPMQTQLLRGIEELRPYHWRGERADLVDFNVAFAGLLGGAELDTDDGGDFAAFQSYIFSLRNPANPFEHPDRVITDDTTITEFVSFLAPPPGPVSAVDGQDTYFTKPNVGASNCQDCHELPTGTGNDFFQDGFFDQSHRSGFVVPAYNGMWRKHQPERVLIEWADGDLEVRPPLGQGVSHAGLKDGVDEFVNDLFPALSVQEKRNITSFVHQVDSGLAPFVHEARIFDQDHFAETRSWFLGKLIPQVLANNVDVALFGTFTTPGGAELRLRWYLDRELRRFVAEDSTIPPQPITLFFDQAQQGLGTMIVLGTPVGMAKRWAVDQDNDGLFNLDEVRLGTSSATVDSDMDGWSDGAEVDGGGDPLDPASMPVDGSAPEILDVREVYTTARVVKLIATTGELTTASAECVAPGLPAVTAVSDRLTDHHTLIARYLQPSDVMTNTQNIYTCTVTVVDEGGNPASQVVSNLETSPFVFAIDVNTPNESITQYLDLTYTGPAAAGGHEFSFETQLDHRRYMTPLDSHVAAARVIVNGVRTDTVMLAGGPAPMIMMHEAGALGGTYFAQGPFVVTDPTVADGVAIGSFRLPNVTSGDVVEIAIETAGAVDDTFDPLAPAFLLSSLYDFPNSPVEGRVSGAVVVP